MWLLIDAYQPDILGELKPHFIERKFFERSNRMKQKKPKDAHQLVITNRKPDKLCCS